ncbi:MAG: vWA domain-containing protein [Pseudonocardiaceae bacterium]
MPLILKKESIPRTAVGPVKSRTPDVAVVYATSAGEVSVFDPGMRDRWSRRVFARYRLRYEVDLGDHRRTVELRTSPLPARGGIYHFDTFFDVGFRVVDPEAIVRRDVDDGLTVVYNRLIDVCRPITRRFDIEEDDRAEDAINDRFRAGDTLLEGIHIFHLSAQLSSDTGSRRHRQTQVEAERSDIEKSAQHQVHVNDAVRTGKLDLIKQDNTLRIRDRERSTMTNRTLDFQELIRIHLERYPHDTQTALQMLRDMEGAQWERREVQEQRTQELFRFLANNNLIQAVDLGAFRDQVMTQFQNPPEPRRLAGAAPGQYGQPSTQVFTQSDDGWNDPLPPLGAVPAAAHRPDVIPIYVVIDRSTAVQPCVNELNAGLNSLFDALIAEPAVGGAVRLSVIGYADEVDIRLELATVQPGTERVQLSAHGPAHYAAAFEQLLDSIPRDVEQLKSQQPNVRRPQVLFLSGAQPTDESRWSSVYQRLVDRNQQRYAPEIVACGVGAARPETIARVATRRELAFIAESAVLPTSVEQYFVFVTQQIVAYGRSVLDGLPGPVIFAPDGFRPACDLV